MQKKVGAIHESPVRLNRGFTLIELLIVVSIVGILFSIAIPQFIAYRLKVYDASVQADVRTAVIAQTAYYLQHSDYTESLVDLQNLGLRQSENISLDVRSRPAGFEIVGSVRAGCREGTGEWTYSTQTGRMMGVPCR